MTIGKCFCVATFAILLAMVGCRRMEDGAQGRVEDADVGGHRLHMLIVGQSGPTVVLESGLGGGLGWEKVRSGIGGFARTITYDRAGFGNSEPGPQPRTAQQIALELHTALRHAGLPPPYVLVGHSMGGPYVRVYAALYPDEVSGLVLVDPTQVNAYESMEDIHSWFNAHNPEDWEAVRAACDQRPEASHGLAWMFALEAKRMEQFLATVPEPRRESLRREWKARMAGAQAATESFQEAIAAKPLPRVPIILLAASGSGSISEFSDSLDPNVRLLQDQVLRWHLQDYREWVEATPGAKLIVASGCGHNIPADDPDLVVAAVRQVLEDGRNAR